MRGTGDWCRGVASGEAYSVYSSSVSEIVPAGEGGPSGSSLICASACKARVRGCGCRLLGDGARVACRWLVHRAGLGSLLRPLVVHGASHTPRLRATDASMHARGGAPVGSARFVRSVAATPGEPAKDVACPERDVALLPACLGGMRSPCSPHAAVLLRNGRTLARTLIRTAVGQYALTRIKTNGRRHDFIQYREGIFDLRFVVRALAI